MHTEHRTSWLPPKLPWWRWKQQEQSIPADSKGHFHFAEHSCGFSCRWCVYLLVTSLFCSPVFWLLWDRHACTGSSEAESSHSPLCFCGFPKEIFFGDFSVHHNASSLTFTFLTPLLIYIPKPHTVILCIFSKNVHQHLKCLCSKQGSLSFYVCSLLTLTMLPSTSKCSKLNHPSQQRWCLSFIFTATTTDPEILCIFFFYSSCTCHPFHTS